MKAIDRLQKTLLPIANFMQKNRYIKAIRNGCVLSLPFIMVGSILTSIMSIESLGNLLGDSLLAEIQDFINPTSVMSSSIMAIFVVIGIAYSLSNEYDVNPLHGAITSLVLFLITCPSFATTKDGAVIDKVLKLDYVGSKAILTAILMAFLGVEVYRWAIRHKITIKLPDSVPTAIKDSFTTFVPAGIVMILGLIIRKVFLLTAQGNLTDFIFYWIQAPLQNSVLSLPSMYIYGCGVNLFWFFGMHGQSMLGSIWRPFLLAASAENVEALASGLSAPNIIDSTYARGFIIFGYWIAIPLLVALFLYTKKHKRSDWKQVMKISAIPGLFNIYEPLMFGLPLVLNPFALIPMLLTPVLTNTVFYGLMSTGILASSTGITVPSTTPIGLAGILSTNSIAVGIVQLIMIVPLAAIWYFFLSLQDKSERATGVYVEDEAIESK